MQKTKGPWHKSEPLKKKQEMSLAPSDQPGTIKAYEEGPVKAAEEVELAKGAGAKTLQEWL